MARLILAIAVLSMLGCSSQTQIPPNTAVDAPISLPAYLADVQDGRQGFYRFYCRLNMQAGSELPDYRDCDEALLPPPGADAPADSPIDRSDGLRDADIILVPGLGWDCISDYVGGASPHLHLADMGYQVYVPTIEGISSSERNAQLIYGYLVNNKLLDNGRDLVFIGYSKGTIDILQTLVSFPHVSQQTLAVVSIAGAVWGTPLADTTSEKALNLYDWVPGKDCTSVDRGALDSLKPALRAQWLEDNRLPDDVLFYSLVTYPGEDEISRGLRSSYKELATVTPYNDGELIYYDQVIPGSTLLAYLRGDHLAVGVPVARDHALVASMALDKNAYPRELLYEAILLWLAADLQLH